MSKFIDLTGREFGRLKVLEYSGQNEYRKSLWLCQCDCKNKIIVYGSDLKSGHTKSCGCLRKEMTSRRSIKHGHYGDEIYYSWSGMIQRCTNPNHKQWKDYGGRGITVCKEWLHSFLSFNRDNPDWKPGLTLERDKNELGYFPGNCYWATRKEQARNRRNSRYATYEGKRWLFIELCEEYNMPYGIVYKRFYNYGWLLKKALTIPARKIKRKNNE